MDGRRVVAIAAAALAALAGVELLYRACWALAGAASSLLASPAVFELYVVGESTAAGVPYEPGITPAWLVSARFGHRVRGKPIRIIDLAGRGPSIWPQSVSFERALRLRPRARPGAVLIYAGHNDAWGLRGARSLERARDLLTAWSMILRDLWPLAERRWNVLSVRTEGTYAKHLDRVVAMGLRSGLVPILSTVVSNTADMDPMLRPAWGLSRREAAALIDRGRTLEAGRRFAEAAGYYRGLARAHPEMETYMEYRLGKCAQGLGRWDEARRLFEGAASGQNDSFGRAGPGQNEAVRALARRRSVPLVDAAALFAAASPHGLVGDALFADGHHPNIAGYLILSEAYARRLSEAFGEPIQNPIAGPADAFALASFGRERQSAALTHSGKWLVSVSLNHGYPKDRLLKARERFLAASKLDPDNADARLGLGVAEAGLRADILADPAAVDWLRAGSR